MKPPKQKLKCIVIQHLSFEGLGVLKQVLLKKNYNIFYKRVGIDNIEQQDIFDADLLILLGSPISVNHTTKYPWLINLTNSIGQRLLNNGAMLGICFGAQLIALILGAKVFSIKKEIGWSFINLSPKGVNSCLSELENQKVLHWHGETFDLPTGAQLLASTNITENQAFSVGNNVLGLQFHCEVSGDEVEPWLIGHHHELISLNIDISELRKNSNSIGFKTCLSSKKMFLNWIEGI